MKHLLLSILILTTLITADEITPSQEEVTKIYVATFKRAPDKAGLAYWVNDSGLKLSEIAQSFFDQAETKVLYPEGTSNSEFITSVYDNLFNRIPDTEGLSYWEGELTRGAISKNSFIQAVINGAKNTATSNDADILTNKTRVGLSFSEAGLEDTDNSKAKSIMSGVTADAASVSSAVAGFGISLYSSTAILNYPLAQYGYILISNNIVASIGESEASAFTSYSEFQTVTNTEPSTCPQFGFLSEPSSSVIDGHVNKIYIDRTRVCSESDYSGVVGKAGTASVIYYYNTL